MIDRVDGFILMVAYLAVIAFALWLGQIMQRLIWRTRHAAALRREERRAWWLDR
jgi:hypothetical protein